MQDRFKYRAWDKENKKYIYDVEKGLEFYSTAGNLRVMTLAEIAESSKYDLEQCTGLKDKNGKLIYEGDIVTGFFNNNKVIWDKSSFCVDDGSGVFDELTKSSEESTIIGNIHENPELLEDNNVKHSE